MNTEILINSSLVTHDGYRESYEFVLNESLCVIECIKVDPMAQNMISPIEDIAASLNGLLFELNHVRVNPRVDTSFIIGCLTEALKNIGVEVKNQPDSNSMATCFKPLGEISDNVRFYLNNNTQVVFLSPSTRPRLVVANSKRLDDNEFI